MHLNMSYAKWRTFCLGDELKIRELKTTQNENRTYNALDVLYILSYKLFANVTNGLLYASHA